MKNVELKKKIYSLLYNKPILPIDDKKEIKVLITADEETESVELFKAVLWAGQYPDTALKVTVCVKNSAAFIDKIKSEMPGIETFFSIDGVHDPSNPLAYVSICKKEQADKSLFDRVFDMVPNEVDMELQALTENINFAYALYENERVRRMPCLTTQMLRISVPVCTPTSLKTIINRLSHINKYKKQYIVCF